MDTSIVKNSHKHQFHFVLLLKCLIFTNTKDKIALPRQLSAMLKFAYPGFSCSYIGKTERTVIREQKAQSFKKQSAIFKQVSSCLTNKHILNMFSALNNDVNIIKLKHLTNWEQYHHFR